MPREQLAEITTKLRGATDAKGKFPPADSPFWGTLPGDDEEEREEMASDIQMELEGARLCASCEPGLFTGDLACAESRLSLVLHQVKGIVYVASHEMEPLWSADGIKYHTVVVSPAIEPSKTLAAQLSATCSFLRHNRPALICSSSPSLPSVVLSAVLLSVSQGQLTVESVIEQCRECGALSEGEVGHEEVKELRNFAATLKQRALLSLAVPAPSSPLAPPLTSPTSQGIKRTRDEAAGVVSPAAKTAQSAQSAGAGPASKGSAVTMSRLSAREARASGDSFSLA